jgi:hypothetical protein
MRSGDYGAPRPELSKTTRGSRRLGEGIQFLRARERNDVFGDETSKLIGIVRIPAPSYAEPRPAWRIGMAGLDGIFFSCACASQFGYSEFTLYLES